MFEQVELQDTQMGPNGPPNAKGTAQIAPQIANSSRKPGLWGHFSQNGQNGHFWVILASHFPARVDTPKKRST